jgi:ATP-dependent DNA helicase RecQ
MVPDTDLGRAEASLKVLWGHAALRFHQRKAVLAALRDRDCLALLPTGGGKSICFALPAVLKPGLPSSRSCRIRSPPSGSAASRPRI